VSCAALRISVRVVKEMSNVKGDRFASGRASSAIDRAYSGNSTPTFYMMDKELGEEYSSGFQSHPARVNTLEEADFVVTCCFRLGSLHKFVDLPRRSKTKPYLVMAHGLVMDGCSNRPDQSGDCGLAKKLMEQREDFTFVSFDLRDHLLTDNNAKSLPGVTLPPPKFYSGPPLSPSQHPAYFLTFRGKVNNGFFGSSHVRSQIQEAFKRFESNGTVVEFLPHNHTYSPTDVDTYNALLNTSYALVPHGDGRWNYRFSEVVGACAIPVVIADGLTLPFEELIDWTTAAVILREETYMPKLVRLMGEAKVAGTASHLRFLLDPKFLLEQLPTDPDEIREKRRRVCELNDKYFSSAEKRVTALLKAAAIRAHP
jgi:hypothetical protein